MNDGRLRIILLISLGLLTGCASAPNPPAQISTASSPGSGTEQHALITELRRQYDTDQSPAARRAVCLRAIDEGVIRRGGSVSTIDALFGTQFSSSLPLARGAIATELILFSPQYVPTPRPDGQKEGLDHVGWYMAFDYDHNGILQNYYLTNLHKGNGSPLRERKMPVSELRRSSEEAKSEVARRDACIRAIDEGAFITYRPVSQVDEVLGTRFASDLPTKKESIRKAKVEFNTSDSTRSSGGSWFMEIEYDFSGQLLGYILTNVRN